MSSTGNRSNPNETRIGGRPETNEARGDAGAKPDIGRQGGATHQESRDHNKHNKAGQSGHAPQKHSPAQEKH
ncbi:hypothetical protein HPT29_002595 [Microvirga terrae]|uniref:Stress-induced protein n=1 Tax=Microvirga terrae TaxID=2740529 RepID=A0ABY5RS23_9HYPH|nr:MULTISPECIES: hypothetical protein [Microvirga]MBQ0824108.1 hypothetical protein [Microvirga sp. HBU67558]UVF20060.1 hypothetical protein HPT29_002595 [Microvirga terrae]